MFRLWPNLQHSEARLQEEMAAHEVVEDVMLEAADAMTGYAQENAQSDLLSRVLLAHIGQAR